MHGYTKGEIASQLSVSLRIVETHRARLMQKLGPDACGTGRLRHRGWPRPSPLTRYLTSFDPAPGAHQTGARWQTPPSPSSVTTALRWCSKESRANSTREPMFNFRNICRRWKSTVCRERYSWLAAWGLLRPSATRSTTRRSASVRLSHPETARAPWQARRRPGPSSTSRARTRASSSLAPICSNPARARSNCARAWPRWPEQARRLPASSRAVALPEEQRSSLPNRSSAGAS